MERQTRQLLSLLAEELIDRILTELTRGPLPERKLRSRLASSRQTLNRHLERLQSWGIVECEERSQGGPGRPARIWQLAAHEVVHFSAEADAFVLQVLEGRTERHRARITSRSRGRLRAVESNRGTG